MFRSRSYVCVDCGVMVDKRPRSDRARVCVSCGIRRSALVAYRRSSYGQQRRAVRARQSATSTEV